MTIERHDAITDLSIRVRTPTPDRSIVQQRTGMRIAGRQRRRASSAPDGRVDLFGAEGGHQIAFAELARDVAAPAVDHTALVDGAGMLGTRGDIGRDEWGARCELDADRRVRGCIRLVADLSDMVAAPAPHVAIRVQQARMSTPRGDRSDLAGTAVDGVAAHSGETGLILGTGVVTGAAVTRVAVEIGADVPTGRHACRTVQHAAGGACSRIEDALLLAGARVAAGAAVKTVAIEVDAASVTLGLLGGAVRTAGAAVTDLACRAGGATRPAVVEVASCVDTLPAAVGVGALAVRSTASVAADLPFAARIATRSAVAVVARQIDALVATRDEARLTGQCAGAQPATDLAGPAGDAAGTAVDPVAEEIDALPVAYGQTWATGCRADAGSVRDFAGRAGVAAGTAVLSIPVEIDALTVAVRETGLTIQRTDTCAVAQLTLCAGSSAATAVFGVDGEDRFTAVGRIPVAVGETFLTVAQSAATALTGTAGRPAHAAVIRVAPGADACLHRSVAVVDLAARLSRSAEGRAALALRIVDWTARRRAATAGLLAGTRGLAERPAGISARARPVDAELSGAASQPTAAARPRITFQVAATRSGTAGLVRAAYIQLSVGAEARAATAVADLGCPACDTARAAVGGVRCETHAALLTAPFALGTDLAPADALSVDARLGVRARGAARSAVVGVVRDVDTGVIAAALRLGALLETARRSHVLWSCVRICEHVRRRVLAAAAAVVTAGERTQKYAGKRT